MEMNFYRLLLVDGKNLAMRNFFAFSPDLSAAGYSTNLLHGSLLEIAKYLKEDPVEDLIVCWDSPSAYRRKIYPEYKSKRRQSTFAKDSALVEDMFRQLALFRQALSLLPIRQFEIPDIEGDDLIAFFAIQRRYHPLTIVSGDHDFWQLVRSGVSIFDARTKKMITVENFKKETGFLSPSQLLVYMYIKGDGDECPRLVNRLNDQKARQIASELKPVDIRNGQIYFQGDHEFQRLPGYERNVRLVDLRVAVWEQIDVILQHQPVPGKADWDAFTKFCASYRLKHAYAAFADIWQKLKRNATHG